ncbi:IS3 family transposase [Idiomarina sp. PL1-037]|uniref:IS3 family transposase n=1 Tax=Idiomarina sp. PL1-037 TaxID=3095365 RepID=UPI003A103388
MNIKKSKIHSFKICFFDSCCVAFTHRRRAGQDVFDYIEMFYNMKRRHSSNDQLG